MRFTDVSVMCIKLTDGLAMTSSCRGRPIHVGHSPEVHPLKQGLSWTNIDIGLRSLLATKAAMLSPHPSPYMISLISVIVFTGVLFHRLVSKSNECLSCRSTACIFALPSFSSSRFSSLRVDNRALCLTAEIVYCFPFKEFSPWLISFLIYWPYFCCQTLYAPLIIRPVGWEH